MISAFINAYQEEKQIEKCIKSLKGINDIVVVDHESTDKTAFVAKSLGARVFVKPVFTEKVTKYDVDEFTRRFGLKPFFKVGNKIINWSVDMNSNLSLLKHDWTLYLDCDERLVGDITNLDLAGYDVVSCKLTRPNKDTISTRKLFRKSRVWFIHHLHQMVVGQDIKELFTDKISLEHVQTEREHRKTYPKSCEFAFMKDNSLRMNYYLAREYFHAEEFERSFKFFKLFLESATLPLDRSKAYTLMSGCLWQMGKREESYMYLFFAMREYPYYSQPFLMMANLIGADNPKNALMWSEFAKIAKENTPL